MENQQLKPLQKEQFELVVRIWSDLNILLQSMGIKEVLSPEHFGLTENPEKKEQPAS